MSSEPTDRPIRAPTPLSPLGPPAGRDRIGPAPLPRPLTSLVGRERDLSAVVALLRRPDVALVTPGIRPRDAKADDQTRVMTPAEAARAGFRVERSTIEALGLCPACVEANA